MYLICSQYCSTHTYPKHQNHHICCKGILVKQTLFFLLLIPSFTPKSCLCSKFSEIDQKTIKQTMNQFHQCKVENRKIYKIRQKKVLMRKDIFVACCSIWSFIKDNVNARKQSWFGVNILHWKKIKLEAWEKVCALQISIKG